MLNRSSVNLCKILWQRAVPLQTANLEHTRAILCNAFESLVLVEFLLSRWRHNPRTVDLAFRALHGEMGAIGSRGGVEAFESLDLGPCFFLPEVDDPRVLEGGRRRQDGGESVTRWTASDQYLHRELVDKGGDLDWVEVGLRKCERIRKSEPTINQDGAVNVCHLTSGRTYLSVTSRSSSRGSGSWTTEPQAANTIKE